MKHNCLASVGSLWLFVAGTVCGQADGMCG